MKIPVRCLFHCVAKDKHAMHPDRILDLGVRVKMSASSPETFCLTIPYRTKYPRWLVPAFLGIVSIHGFLVPIAVLLLPSRRQRDDQQVSAYDVVLESLITWTFDLLPFFVARLFLLHLGVSLLYIGYTLLDSDSSTQPRCSPTKLL